MVFNATFNNISVILCLSVSLVEETIVLEENHRSLASHWQTLSHKVVSSTAGFKLTTLVVIGTDLAQVVVNPTSIPSRPWRPQHWLESLPKCKCDARYFF